ncbi:hypothetical protein EAN90_18640 [Vibrio parahaemolyticus]|nr:hypothetical protein [Vibrio parahaemolyticus]
MAIGEFRQLGDEFTKVDLEHKKYPLVAIYFKFSNNLKEDSVSNLHSIRSQSFNNHTNVLNLSLKSDNAKEATPDKEPES